MAEPVVCYPAAKFGDDTSCGLCVSEHDVGLRAHSLHDRADELSTNTNDHIGVSNNNSNTIGDRAFPENVEQSDT